MVIEVSEAEWTKPLVAPVDAVEEGTTSELGFARNAVERDIAPASPTGFMCKSRSARREGGRKEDLKKHIEMTEGTEGRKALKD